MFTKHKYEHNSRMSKMLCEFLEMLSELTM